MEKTIAEVFQAYKDFMEEGERAGESLEGDYKIPFAKARRLAEILLACEELISIPEDAEELFS